MKAVVGEGTGVAIGADKVDHGGETDGVGGTIDVGVEEEGDHGVDVVGSRSRTEGARKVVGVVAVVRLSAGLAPIRGGVADCFVGPFREERMEVVEA